MFRSNVPPANLPDGWRPAQLAEIATVHGGGRLKLNKSHYIEAGARAYSAAGPDGFVELVEGREPSVVLSSIGARCGKAFLTTGPWTTLANTQVITPKCQAASADFLHAVLDDETYWSRSGSAQPFIKPSDVKGAWVPLPPLDEQQRIAEVLKSAFEAAEGASKVVHQCGRVIQTEADSVVGELVSDHSVPVVRLGDVANVKGGKRLPKGNEYSDSPTGHRYVRVTDWNDYEIDPTHVRWITSEAASAIRRYTISSADLFISIAGSIGLVASVPSELDGSYLTENAAKIVLREHREIDRDYLLVALMSRSLTQQIRQQKGVGGGVPKLALFRIEALEIPLPPLERQREIAASYRSLRAARSSAHQASMLASGLCEKLTSDLLSGRVRVPA